MITWDEKLVAQARVLLDSELHLMESLTAIRKKRGITQAEVARRMGVSQPAVAALEHYAGALVNFVSCVECTRREEAAPTALR